MSNRADARASREEEIAFLTMEEILGVEITLADAGEGDRKPDGKWTDPSTSRRCIVEVTAPEETKLLTEWARAKKNGRRQEECGCVPVRWGDLAEVCSEILAENWALENVKKLRAEPADERHLFLFAHGERYGDYFNRLSDRSVDRGPEPVETLAIPDGLDCVWFRGRAMLHSEEQWELNLARFDRNTGWHRDIVTIAELALPSPAPGITRDKRQAEQRHPKRRTPHTFE